MKARLFVAAGFASALLFSCGSPPASDSEQPGSVADVTPTFSSLNENVFQPKCVSCHNATRHESGVDLSNLSSIMASSMTHGDPVVVPGKPSQSHLYEMVASGEMPPGGKLSAQEIDAIRVWIEQGANNN